MINIPVIIFGYKRPIHLESLLDSLEKCKGADTTDVYIFLDGGKKNDDVEALEKTYKVAQKKRNFKSKTVTVNQKNKGLASSVIQGVTEILSNYDEVIVLEDDLEVNENYLIAMNRMLKKYKYNEKIWAICGYSFPIDISSVSKDWYAVNRASSWGWATWKNRWESIEWDLEKLLRNYKEKLPHLYNDIPDSKMMIYNYRNGFINSWALRWTLNQYFTGSLSLSPKYSLIKNKGFDGDATHGSMKKNLNLNYRDNFVPLDTSFYYNHDIAKEFKSFCKPTIYNYTSFVLRKIHLYQKVRSLLNK